MIILPVTKSSQGEGGEVVFFHPLRDLGSPC